MSDYWQRQTKDKPLFEDLLWSRPETKRAAGKLLIVGGNAQGFAAAASAYAEATRAGVGSAKVLLPDHLQPTVGKVLAAGEYAPSTPSGSFARSALAEMLAMSQWSDGVLIAGDLGRNSETAVLLEQFVVKYEGHLTITKDAADYFTKSPSSLLSRPNTLLVVSFAQLQKIASSARFPKAFMFEMDLIRLIDQLHDFTLTYNASLIVKHLNNILVADKGRVSSTKLNEAQEVWRVKAAAHASVWWLQNPSRTYEALTSSLIDV